MSDLEHYKEITRFRLDQTKNKLLELKKGWGDDPDNEPFSPVHLDTISDFVLKLLSHFHSIDKKIDYPVIAPAGNKSIDIHWNNDLFRLLINHEKNEDFEGVDTGIYGKSSYRESEINWQGKFDDCYEIVSEWLEKKIMI